MPGRTRTLFVALAGLLIPSIVGSQTVLERSPNLAGAWTGASGVLHFNFLHRFSISSAPERKVTSTPTFLLAAGLPARTLVGVHYATNSELSARYPNEWELFGRFAAVDQEMGAPVDASVQVGYNLAAEGLDGEAAIARRQGALRVLGAVRLLADPDAAGMDVALGTGLVVGLTRHIGVSADVVTLTDRGPSERVAWGVGLNLAIPRTPHTISLHATNVNNATLQSSSRGTGETRYGFEFTIPLTLSRYFGSDPPRPAVSPMPADTTGVSGSVTTAAVDDFLFRPARIEVEAGTTIVWTNRGQVVHTVTGDEGNFASGAIEPGSQENITFTRPGTYPYHCTPHPFMRGVVVVR